MTVRLVLLCVWWNWKGKIHYKLLPYGRTPNSTIYCELLDCLKQAIDQMRPELAKRMGIIFHQDKARPHTLLWLARSYGSLNGRFYRIHHIPWTYCQLISICPYSWRMLLVELNSTQKRLVQSDCPVLRK